MMSANNDRTQSRSPRAGRALAAALASLALLLALAPPAVADDVNMDARGHVDPALDALFLRPLGLAATAAGAVLFVAAVPFVAITRPTEIGKPFKFLVMAPVRYTWMDPLGNHSSPPNG